MSRRTADQFHHTIAPGRGKSSDEILAALFLKLVQESLVMGLPTTGLRHQGAVLCMPIEGPFIFRRRLFAVFQITDQSGSETLVSQHLCQHWRDPNGQCRPRTGRTAATQLIEDAQKRQIGLRRGLPQPLFAMRPDAVTKHIRQVRVKDKAEFSRLRHRESKVNRVVQQTLIVRGKRWEAVRNVAGIPSPSRVTRSIGANLSVFSLGLERQLDINFSARPQV